MDNTEMDTRTVYNAWSEIYDTDGNFLQALDSLEMKTLLPRMISMLTSEKPWRLVDLGCGTGRNTMALLEISDVEVIALDLSTRMMEIAQKKLDEKSRRLSVSSTVSFEIFDMLSAAYVPEKSKNSDAVVSTLVAEHVPLDIFFNTIVAMLKPGGLALVTNMHSDMGMLSGAGFNDPETGLKVRPTSYAHTLENLVEEAGKQGLKLACPIKEAVVDASLAPALGKRADKWVGITVWFGAIFHKTA